MKVLNYIFVIIFLSCIFSNCERRKNYNVLQDIHEVWGIWSVDSSYYEYYFDNSQNFLFDSKDNLAYILNTNDLFLNFLKKINNDNVVQKRQLVCKYLNDNDIIVAKIDTAFLIENYCYYISNDVNDNYILFSRESTKRWWQYRGIVHEDEKNSIHDVEIIEIP